MIIKRTPCCALLFLQAKNYDNVDIMYKKLLKKYNELDQISWHGYGKGETTIQCIVKKEEIILRRNLKKLGFRKTLEFNRREVSNRDGYKTTLDMYVLKLHNLKNPKKI